MSNFIAIKLEQQESKWGNTIEFINSTVNNGKSKDLLRGLYRSSLMIDTIGDGFELVPRCILATAKNTPENTNRILGFRSNGGYMGEVNRINEYYKEYIENIKSSLRIRGREIGLKIDSGAIERIAVAITNQAFEQKNLTQEKTEWILRSWLRDPVEKQVLSDLSYLVWKDTI